MLQSELHPCSAYLNSRSIQWLLITSKESSTMERSSIPKSEWQWRLCPAGSWDMFLPSFTSCWGELQCTPCQTCKKKDAPRMDLSHPLNVWITQSQIWRNKQQNYCIYWQTLPLLQLCSAGAKMRCRRQVFGSSVCSLNSTCSRSQVASRWWSTRCCLFTPQLQFTGRNRSKVAHVLAASTCAAWPG